MIVGSILGGSGSGQKTPSENTQSTETQQTSEPEQETAQPVTQSSDSSETNNSGADDGSASEKDSQQQAAAATPSRTSAAPAKADPQSVVTAITETARARAYAELSVEQARTKALIDSVSVVQEQPDLFEQPNRVDRYAPPDPLPTSETLKSAAATAPQTKVGPGSA